MAANPHVWGGACLIWQLTLISGGGGGEGCLPYMAANPHNYLGVVHVLYGS